MKKMLHLLGLLDDVTDSPLGCERSHLTVPSISAILDPSNDTTIIKSDYSRLLIGMTTNRMAQPVPRFFL